MIRKSHEERDIIIISKIIEEDIPKNGDIIRMMDENYNYLCYGTRVKVTNLRHSVPSDKEKLSVIRYVAATLD